MSDIKNDPSQLYDADFMKKREQMFSEQEDVEDISSETDGKIPEQEYERDAFEERGGLFSRLRKRKRKKGRDADDDGDDDGYDIFDLENLFDEADKQKDSAESPTQPGAIDDINALLESVGIGPIEAQADEDSDVKIAEEKTEQPKEAEKTEQDASKQQTDSEKPKEDIEKTRVIEASASAEQDSKDKTVSDKTKHFETVGKKADKQADKQVDKPNNGSDEGKAEQLMLEGYADEEGPAKTSEEAVEVELKKTRKNLIDNFRVLANGESDKPILEHEPTGEAKQSLPDSLDTKKGEDLFKAVEKAGKIKKATEFFRRGAKSIKSSSQKARKKEQMVSATALSKSLKVRRKKRDIQAKILLGLTAVSLILSFMASSYDTAGALDFLFANGARVYTAVSLLLTAAGVAVSFDIFKNAFESVKAFKCDTTVITVLLTLFIFVHHIAMLVTGMYIDTGMTLYSAYALFALTVQTLSEKYALSSTIKAISFMAKGGKLTGVQPIDNKADAGAIGYGISDNGEPNIYFAADVDIPSNLDELTRSSRADEKFLANSSMVILAASFVYALILSISLKNASVFAGALISSICVCLPMMRGMVLAALSRKVNESLASASAVIAGFDACEDIGKANAVVFDTGDIFEGKISKFRRVPGSRMAVEDAVAYAASTLKNTKCILASGFDDFIKEAGINLPEAEDVVYEEKLGYSSWVAGRKVLVGTREMLVQHSVESPTAEEEQAYAKGKSVMYVAVEGVIAATFIASYSVRSEARKSIHTFNKSGLVLMLNTGDPCLNEAKVASKLSADIAAIKIVSTNGSEIISQYRNNQTVRKDNGLVCIKKKRNVFSLVTAAHSLYFAERTATVINIAGILFSFILMIICAALKVSTGFSAIAAIALQLAWGAGAYFAGDSRIKGRW